MKDKTGCVLSHVVFTIKNSRYYYQRIKRMNPIGYVAKTFPCLIDKEEDDIVEVLCHVAVEIQLELIAFNFCGDHVHCIVCVESGYFAKKMLLWKGKTAYKYNRRFNLLSKNPTERQKSYVLRVFGQKVIIKGTLIMKPNYIIPSAISSQIEKDTA